ncbi:MAG: hypothetical protein LUD12_10245 [Lachnospiraceae bacterium]|nr:hypothetical protein [Lachnospiraceae bacterium]
MSLGWSDLTAEGKKYFEELEKLAKLEVRVGFQEGVMTADGEASLAEIAAYNELGTSNIPARPFMKQSFENHQGELQKACDQVNTALANGGTAGEALQPLGVYLKGLVQDEILEGGFKPNAASTIKKKGSATPLIDTGHMRQSVNYEIKERSE